MLPGISAVMAMTLMLGLVFRLPVDAGIGLLVGIYSAAIYGAVSQPFCSIFRAPRRAATVLDGHAMARKGKAREVIGIATWSSFIGEMGEN